MRSSQKVSIRNICTLKIYFIQLHNIIFQWRGIVRHYSNIYGSATDHNHTNSESAIDEYSWIIYLYIYDVQYELIYIWSTFKWRNNLPIWNKLIKQITIWIYLTKQAIYRERETNIPLHKWIMIFSFLCSASYKLIPKIQKFVLNNKSKRNQF